jgi:glycoprotein 3-alpha-L-fucosyltransferase/alpha-1,3-fucosyltransferase
MDVCYRRGELQPTDRPCVFTSDRNRLPSVDAVVFRARKLNIDDLPETRSPDQQFLVHEVEPPHKTWIFANLTQFNGYFNLTSTFAWDSDIPYNEHRRYVVDPDEYSRLATEDFASRKRSDVPVAWFVSRCPTQSKRESYFEELRKYISIDVYGKCGNLTCDDNQHASSDQCVNRLLDGQNSYKFYLSFENSVCEDYVTEKFNKVLLARVIPVVMGAFEYSKMVPSESFIDVRDYKSPKDLADFLHYLNNNDDAYNQRMRIKRSLQLFTIPLPHRQVNNLLLWNANSIRIPHFFPVPVLPRASAAEGSHECGVCFGQVLGIQAVLQTGVFSRSPRT